MSAEALPRQSPRLPETEPLERILIGDSCRLVHSVLHPTILVTAARQITKYSQFKAPHQRTTDIGPVEESPSGILDAGRLRIARVVQ